MATISSVVLIVIIAAAIYFRFRPPEMSEKGLKHFRSGLLFAIISSLFGLTFWVFASRFANHPPSQLLIMWVWAGNL